MHDLAHLMPMVLQVSTTIWMHTYLTSTCQNTRSQNKESAFAIRMADACFSDTTIPTILSITMSAYAEALRYGARLFEAKGLNRARQRTSRSTGDSIGFDQRKEQTLEAFREMGWLRQVNPDGKYSSSKRRRCANTLQRRG